MDHDQSKSDAARTLVLSIVPKFRANPDIFTSLDDAVAQIESKAPLAILLIPGDTRSLKFLARYSDLMKIFVVVRATKETRAYFEVPKTPANIFYRRGERVTAICERPYPLFAKIWFTSYCLSANAPRTVGGALRPLSGDVVFSKQKSHLVSADDLENI